jgi:hypothetical protein
LGRQRLVLVGSPVRDNSSAWKLVTDLDRVLIAQSFCLYRAGVEVDYRLARTLRAPCRCQYVERRAGREVVHVEVAPGVVIVAPAWTLDPAACAGMVLGAPRVTLSVLAELHQLLIERGFRRSSRDDPIIVKEE